jgi:hypothetical protein
MKVQVELLWIGGIRPPRGDVAVDGLERHHRARERVESRPAVADRPPRIRMIDAAAKQGAIEFRGFPGQGSPPPRIPGSLLAVSVGASSW